MLVGQVEEPCPPPGRTAAEARGTPRGQSNCPHCVPQRRFRRRSTSHPRGRPMGCNMSVPGGGCRPPVTPEGGYRHGRTPDCLGIELAICQKSPDSFSACALRRASRTSGRSVRARSRGSGGSKQVRGLKSTQLRSSPGGIVVEAIGRKSCGRGHKEASVPKQRVPRGLRLDSRGLPREPANNAPSRRA